eukprot:7383678-Prymnesium_polylepis.1
MTSVSLLSAVLLSASRTSPTLSSSHASPLMKDLARRSCSKFAPSCSQARDSQRSFNATGSRNAALCRPSAPE